MADIIIRPATSDEIPELVGFITKARAEMFPFLNQASSGQMAQRELESFQKSYLDSPQGAFLTARSKGRLVATIGCVPYDGRFPSLNIEVENVVEVESVRLGEELPSCAQCWTRRPDKLGSSAATCIRIRFCRMRSASGSEMGSPSLKWTRIQCGRQHI